MFFPLFIAPFFPLHYYNPQEYELYSHLPNPLYWGRWYRSDWWDQGKSQVSKVSINGFKSQLSYNTLNLYTLFWPHWLFPEKEERNDPETIKKNCLVIQTLGDKQRGWGVKINLKYFFFFCYEEIKRVLKTCHLFISFKVMFLC